MAIEYGWEVTLKKWLIFTTTIDDYGEITSAGSQVQREIEGDRRSLLQPEVLYKRTLIESINPWIQSFYLTDIEKETPLKCLHIMMSLMKYDIHTQHLYEHRFDGPDGVNTMKSAQQFFPYFTVDLQAALSGVVTTYGLKTLGSKLVSHRTEIPRNFIGDVHKVGPGGEKKDMERVNGVNVTPFLYNMKLLQALFIKAS